MKTIAIIQARMGSSRLPNKVLMPILGKPLLGWMLDRVSLCSNIDDIIVATTKNTSDDIIADFVSVNGYQVYRGNTEDVLDRYYQAAKTYSPDIVIRLTGDCPLIDPRIIETLICDFKNKKIDFISNSEPLPSSWPDGMDVSIMSFPALQKAWHEAIKPSEREHVTFYFWSKPGSFRCERVEHFPVLLKYRLTVDYPEDFDVIKSIVEYFGSDSIERVVKLTMNEIITFLDRHPDIFKLNEKYKRGLGWKASFDKDNSLGLE